MGLTLVSFVIRGIEEHNPERYRELKVVKPDQQESLDVPVPGETTDIEEVIGKDHEMKEDAGWEVKYLNEHARLKKLWDAFQLQEHNLFEAHKRITELENDLELRLE